MHDYAAGSRPAHALLFVVAVFLLGVSASAQTLTIYDDALQNGFENWSYGNPAGEPVFDSNEEAHGGLSSIKFTGNASYNALSFAHPTLDYSTAQYPVLRFWIHGGAAGGQQLRLYLQLDGGIVPAASSFELDAYIEGGAPVANEWREVVVDLTAPPISYAGLFDRIDLQSDAGAQPALYIDDVVLGQPGAEMTAPMEITRDVTIASMVSDRFRWQDSANQPREAVLAHSDAPYSPAAGVTIYSGALRQYSYRLPDGSTRTAGVTGYGNGGWAGFGYVVAHSKLGHVQCVGSDSPLGGRLPGSWQRIFEGRHHAIFRFTQNYPRNCSVAPAPNQQRLLPVTIDWIFSTGRDHPIWAVTMDVEGADPDPNTLFDDTRAPYGELNIDGHGALQIDGVGWGDRYKFATTSAPVTLNSHWEYDDANTVPYVKLWIADALAAASGPGDATMGLVQTQTMDQQDAGGGRDPDYHDLSDLWGTTSAAGNGDRPYRMPWQSEWAYQANAFSIGTAAASNNARLTWGSQYGFLGRTSYVVNDGVVPNAPGFPKKSYSLYVVLGTHSSAPVEAQMTQVETVQSLVLTANVGTVATSGPAGVADATATTYQPAGYDHVYGALAFEAAGNAVDVNIAVGAGTLQNPLVIVRNYGGGEPEVSLDGVALVADADYYASLRPEASELWLTLNRGLNGAVNALVIGGAEGLAAPTGLAATATTVAEVTLTWNASAGADGYEVHRRAAGEADFALLDTTAAPAYVDAAVLADSAYLYRVRATAGAELSAFTSADPAVTIMFLDHPLAVGTLVKQIHVEQLRTAVDALRAVASLDAGLFTDPDLTGLRIKAVHLTQLRTALNEARTELGLPAIVFADPALNTGVTKVKAQHVGDLRDGVR